MKLTKKQIEKIRLLRKKTKNGKKVYTAQALADKFNVSRFTINYHLYKAVRIYIKEYQKTEHYRSYQRKYQKKFVKKYRKTKRYKDYQKNYYYNVVKPRRAKNKV